MRILLLTNKSPWPPKDGGASATLNMIRGLLLHNVSVTLLALNTSKHFIREEDIPVELRKSIDIQLININTSISYPKLLLNFLFSGEPYNINRFRSDKYFSALVSQLDNNFDLIQVEGLHMYHYIKLIKQISGVPVIFRPHNIENIIWSALAEEEINPLKSAYFRVLASRIKKIERRVINEVDAILPISLKDLSWFEKEGLSCPAMISLPGYDSDRLAYIKESGWNGVTFLGALDWIPNLNGLRWFIREVWPLVMKHVPESVFKIAGRNASPHTISMLKGPNIIYEGEVESSAEYLKDKSILVVPLFSGSGIRMKIIEGMSLGKCVVATPQAAESVICENRINIFLAPDSAGFAASIIELIEDPELRIMIANNAIKNVRKNYNILASSENLMNFYRELTS